MWLEKLDCESKTTNGYKMCSGELYVAAEL